MTFLASHSLYWGNFDCKKSFNYIFQETKLSSKIVRHFTNIRNFRQEQFSDILGLIQSYVLDKNKYYLRLKYFILCPFLTEFYKNASIILLQSTLLMFVSRRNSKILEFWLEKQMAAPIFFSSDMLSTRRYFIASKWVWRASTNDQCNKFYWWNWLQLWGCKTSCKFWCCRILRLWHWNLSLSLCHL